MVRVLVTHRQSNTAVTLMPFDAAVAFVMACDVGGPT
jgi:hypothetical protein